MNIKEQFTKEKIISNVAKYELYYQVALGRLTTILKTEEFEYDIEFQYALGSIYELLKDLEKEENLDEIFEDELKKQSAMDALQKFANENLEAIKLGEIDIENIVNEINDNKFFNTAMNEVCTIHLSNQIEKWKMIVSDELANSVLASFEQLEAKS